MPGQENDPIRIKEIVNWQKIPVARHLRYNIRYREEIMLIEQISSRFDQRSAMAAADRPVMAMMDLLGKEFAGLIHSHLDGAYGLWLEITGLS